jgi:hypothetical protein
MPSACASALGADRSLEYVQRPSTSASSTPASSTARTTARHASSNSDFVAPPAFQ